MANKSAVDYSIVIPVYYNEGSLISTIESIKTSVIDQHPEWKPEVIFVDDGSGDASLDELLHIQQAYPDIVRVIKLSRNFGQANAMLAGYMQCKGKCTITLSADGQDPPDLINQMLVGYFAEGYEIVICVRQGRDESWYRIWTSHLFYSIMRRLSFRKMPLGGFDYVLLGRRAVNTLIRNQEAHGFFQGQVLWMGYKLKQIEYRRHERKVGKSRWTFGKKLTYLIDGVASYSFFPIRLASIVGTILAFLGFLYAIIIVIGKLLWNASPLGWAPIMVVVLIIGGVQLLSLGVIGEYVWRILAQVRHREPFIIDAIYDSQHPNSDASLDTNTD